MVPHDRFEGLAHGVARVHGGDIAAGRAVAVGDLELRIGPDLHARIDEQIGLFPLEDGVEAIDGRRVHNLSFLLCGLWPGGALPAITAGCGGSGHPRARRPAD